MSWRSSHARDEAVRPRFFFTLTRTAAPGFVGRFHHASAPRASGAACLRAGRGRRRAACGWARARRSRRRWPQPASIRSARSGPMRPMPRQRRHIQAGEAVHHLQHAGGLMPAAIHPGAVVARQLQRQRRQGGDGAGGAQQMFVLRRSNRPRLGIGRETLAHRGVHRFRSRRGFGRRRHSFPPASPPPPAARRRSSFPAAHAPAPADG